jgi:hypothetical protein
MCELRFDVQVNETALFPGLKAQVSGWVCRLCLQHHRGHPYDIESRCDHGEIYDGVHFPDVSRLHDRADIVDVFSIVYYIRGWV